MATSPLTCQAVPGGAIFFHRVSVTVLSSTRRGGLSIKVWRAYRRAPFTTLDLPTMATNPADLERTTKSLAQRIDKIEARLDKLEASSKAGGGDGVVKVVGLMQKQVAELKNDAESVDRRVTVDMQKINAVFVNARAFDDKLQAQITDLKGKLETLTKAVAQNKKP